MPILVESILLVTLIAAVSKRTWRVPRLGWAMLMAPLSLMAVLALAWVGFIEVGARICKSAAAEMELSRLHLRALAGYGYVSPKNSRFWLERSAAHGSEDAVRILRDWLVGGYFGMRIEKDRAQRLLEKVQVIPVQSGSDFFLKFLGKPSESPSIMVSKMFLNQMRRLRRQIDSLGGIKTHKERPSLSAVGGVR